MFKTQAEIDDIVVDAKAYLYQSTQTIAAELQEQAAQEYYNDVMNANATPNYLIKAIEFIGSNINQNNLFAEALQGSTQSVDKQEKYVEDGYVDTGYTKSNPI
jgi:hypothetical protein